MATKIKGFYKGIKHITHIFVVKETEIEIGCPTDVKHVAHIGWDGPSGSGPTWMNEFKAAPEFSSSLGSISEPRDSEPPSISSSWSCREQSLGDPALELQKELPPSDLHRAPKKHKRRKAKSTLSPKSSSATRASRAGKPKAKHSEADHKALE
ncbi:hypothetical protein SAY86_004496 [Trapa natans]|uniref:CRIB domain-containing protein n=1 Tax=Trapa natans TaxID=22666 RepID=A0AAN7RFM7_TRANT|nr:hypothetical protein SAY86_004496 [Trapa natans]